MYVCVYFFYIAFNFNNIRGRDFPKINEKSDEEYLCLLEERENTKTSLNISEK